MLRSKWFLITNFELDEVDGSVSRSRHGKFFLYGTASVGTAVDGAVTINADYPGRKPSIDTGLYGDNSVVVVSESGITVDTSENCVNPVYFASNRAAGRFAVFSDILLAGDVLAWLGLPLEFRTDFAIGFNSEVPLRSVRRVEYLSNLTFAHAGGGWRMSYEKRPAPLYGRGAELISDIEEAGDVFVSAFEAVIRSIAGSYKEMTLLLSGGIDSAAVAYFASKAGIAIHPFTVGSPWGDELANARETADCIGLDLKFIGFTKEQLAESLVDTIEWVGHADKEIVDIGLTNTCFMKYQPDTPRDLITGYGSDLLSAGYFRTKPTEPTLARMIDDSNYRTRYTNEFSNALASEYERDMIHPYWYRSVQQAAFRIAPAIKYADGQDKVYFRKAMARYLPEAVAWRKKVAVHQGNSMQGGLTDYLEAGSGLAGSAPRLYAEIFKILVEQSTIRRAAARADSEAILAQATERVRRPGRSRKAGRP